MIFLGLAFLLLVPVGGIMAFRAEKKRQRLEAHRKAHRPIFSNVYGGSRETPREAAKKRGWI